MSNNRLIYEIRTDPYLNRLWLRCTDEQKRQIIEELQGDNWNMAQVIEDVLEAK